MLATNERRAMPDRTRTVREQDHDQVRGMLQQVPRDLLQQLAEAAGVVEFVLHDRTALQRLLTHARLSRSTPPSAASHLDTIKDAGS